MTLHEEFRARKWRKNETFSDYMHEKIVLRNRMPIAEKQLLGYIIDGIPHWGLRNNVRCVHQRRVQSTFREFGALGQEERG
jgi:hypothetical protein